MLKVCKKKPISLEVFGDNNEQMLRQALIINSGNANTFTGQAGVNALTKISKFVSKKNKTKIVCLTAYSKNIVEELDKFTDLILVGDSLGSVLYNYKSTRNVTLDTIV